MIYELFNNIVGALLIASVITATLLTGYVLFGRSDSNG